MKRYIEKKKKKKEETPEQTKAARTANAGSKTAQLIPIYPRHDAWDFDSIISFCPFEVL